jgi:hypothetical protein
MKKLAAVVLLMVAGAAWGQSAQLPLTFKGVCSGTQTDIKDMSAIQDTPAIKCDSLTIMQIKGDTVGRSQTVTPRTPFLCSPAISCRITSLNPLTLISAP